ncbi:MAG: 4'-phosphopantetheinyl transferase superfamily protein [Acidobacteriota bacterium]|nr:4'-phosphopantetheinyl transferase superfamily protein [Acidobacteriota bacterium]MXZ37550.1 4'-phosphopantetheinyl transferase superfamily protein [Holophagales bacterium]MDE2851836.1 4'-phosphopantetheinyl transferase superfamily protein [Acidobacteriota bacterium]MDE2921642.1 4'-phosphopantetheinyl transferase superfamily protein [Acidobacteriota bacterium]MDE3266557.1 4'-phosphopantetheinyl transferase superfamily protein [Acidobacteriota bacterium]
MSRAIHRSGRVTVVYVDLGPSAAREREALTWLDGPELARRRQFARSGPRREFTLCRAALRALLCRDLDCANEELSFGTSEHGKPFALVGGLPAPVSFNVSHSGRHGLIAIAPRGRIGVDVEDRRARRDMDDDIRLLFAPGEQAGLASAEGDRKAELFYSLWTMKEALVKAAGVGLRIDTTSFEIPPAMSRGATSCLVRLPVGPSVRWRLENLGNRRYAAALAVEDPPPDAGDSLEPQFA